MVDQETEGRNHSRFFISPELTRRLELLRHLTENSQNIPVVLGPEGSGKSSLIRQLCKQAGDNWVVCPIEAHPMLQPDSLLSLLADTFAVAAGEDLLGRFEALRLDGRLPVVMLDEAHLLPEATIITLLRLHESGAGQRDQVRILLFGEPEFDALLATPRVQAMNTQVLQRLEMPRLTREQTEKMEELVDSGAAGRWRGYSLGRVPPGVTVASILVVAVLFLVLVFQDEINGLFGVAGPDGGSPSFPPRGAGTVELALPSPSAVEPEPAYESGLSGTVEAPVAADTGGQAAASPEAIPAYDSVAEAGDSIPDVAIETEEIVPEEPESIAVPVEQETAPEKPAAPATLDQGVSPGQTSPSKATQPPTPVNPTESAGEAKVPDPAAESPVKPGLLREEWLLQQDPKAYTLQLVAVSEEAGIARFLEQFSLPGQAAYFRTVRQGKPWFPLLYGIYPDRQAAIAARARLPAELLQQSGAWPRSLGSVQEEIRNR